MARRIFHRLRILDFARRENTMKKAFAKTIQRMLNARSTRSTPMRSLSEKRKIEAEAGIGKEIYGLKIDDLPVSD